MSDRKKEKVTSYGEFDVFEDDLQGYLFFREQYIGRLPKELMGSIDRGLICQEVQKWVKGKLYYISRAIEMEPFEDAADNVIRNCLEHFSFHAKGSRFIQDPFRFHLNVDGVYEVSLLDQYLGHEGVLAYIGDFKPRHDKDAEGFRKFLSDYLEGIPADRAERKKKQLQEIEEQIREVEQGLQKIGCES